MPKMFTVTYEVYSPESVELCCAEEIGFVLPGEWREPPATKEDVQLSLREALGLISCVEDSGFWFSETDGRQDYTNGEVEYRSLHFPTSVTKASRGRIERVLKANRLM